MSNGTRLGKLSSKNDALSNESDAEGNAGLEDYATMPKLPRQGKVDSIAGARRLGIWERIRYAY